MNTSTNIQEYFIFKNKGRNNIKLTFNSIGYRICNIENCNQKHKSKGFCSKHYIQIRKNGKITKEETVCNLPNEIWKDVINYKGLYSVSNKGRIKSLKVKRSYLDKFTKTTNERLLKPINRNNYKFIALYKNKKIKYIPIHVLIAESFLPLNNNNDKVQVNHINFDKSDNRPENLEWVTARENTVHYVKSKKCKSDFVGVTFHKSTGKWRSRITINGYRLSLGLFYNEIDAHKAVKNAESILM